LVVVSRRDDIFRSKTVTGFESFDGCDCFDDLRIPRFTRPSRGPSARHAKTDMPQAAFSFVCVNEQR
jgi:hypothetical protein